MKKITTFQKLARFIPRTAYELTVDVAHCNLKCSMCPRGGINDLQNPDRGMMEFDLFKNIVDKFVKEKVWIDGLAIGNWGEPSLNPDLPKIIRYVKSHPTAMKPKSAVRINTTMSRLAEPLELLNSGVDEIVMSFSGMTQEVYSRNHRGGNIDNVLKNIKELARVRKMDNLQKVKLRVVFHDYIYNSEDAKLARDFCEEHGIRFSLHRLYISSVGDAICFSQNKKGLREHYSKFINVDKAISSMKTMDYDNIKNCRLRKNRVAVNFDGQLYRCDGVFEKKHFMGSIFDFNIRDIPDIDSDICRKCAEVPISFRP